MADDPNAVQTPLAQAETAAKTIWQWGHLHTAAASGIIGFLIGLLGPKLLALVL